MKEMKIELEKEDGKIDTSMKEMKTELEKEDRKIDTRMKEMKMELEKEDGNIDSKMKEMKIELEKEDGKIDTRLTELKKDKGWIDTRLRKLEDKDAVKAFFFAKDVRNKYPSNGEILIFNTVSLNVGQGFRVGTGRFQAPVTGVYMFVAVLQMWGNKGTEGGVGLTVNGVEQVRVVSQAAMKTQDVSVPLQALLHLRKGELVDLRAKYGSPWFWDHRNNNLFSSFTGMLISQD